MMPNRDTSPTVGLMPTRQQLFEGDTMEPSVSLPTATAQRSAAIAAADPELEPDVLRSRQYGFFVSPPRALQPLVGCAERMFAHSLRFVLPRITAPACRSFAAPVEALGGADTTHP